MPSWLIESFSVWWVVKVALIAFLWSQVATLVTTVYLHRGLAHSGLIITPAGHRVFRYLLWMTTGARPREWVAVHRRHHASTDEPDDPHSPIQLGYWRVQLGNLWLYRRSARDPETIARFGSDIPTGWLDRSSIAGPVVTACLIAAWLDPLTGLSVLVIGGGLYIQLSSAINALTHCVGYKNHLSSPGTNLRWLAWLTAGEGLHNNHHFKAARAKFSERWSEFDLGWFVTKWVLVPLRQVRLRPGASNS
jgi:stearoyl-CoA desaturase (delta-9 desaturase)